MDSAPKLIFLHSQDSLSPAKLESFRRYPTEWIKSTLRPGHPGALKVRPDGTVLDGHHRLWVLLERDEDIHALPREILRKES